MTAWTKAESDQSNPEHSVCSHGNSDMNTTICRRGCMTSLISALDVRKGNKSSSGRQSVVCDSHVSGLYNSLTSRGGFSCHMNNDRNDKISCLTLYALKMH